jgi:hypothetical protein
MMPPAFTRRALPGGWPVRPDLDALLQPSCWSAGAAAAVRRLVSEHLSQLPLDVDLLGGDEAEGEGRELELEGVGGNGAGCCMCARCMVSDCPLCARWRNLGRAARGQMTPCCCGCS